mmetsp:Transcript_21610/g.66412  ORF Transcript_21610/g.66412 Transcript_21610/m.66412 type:complete len:125 (-) Transcript_21610:54-428(-)
MGDRGAQTTGFSTRLTDFDDALIKRDICSREQCLLAKGMTQEQVMDLLVAEEAEARTREIEAVAVAAAADRDARKLELAAAAAADPELAAAIAASLSEAKRAAPPKSAAEEQAEMRAKRLARFG